ncbi:Hypothetical predicted protein, partial [Marmota monax]
EKLQSLVASHPQPRAAPHTQPSSLQPQDNSLGAQPGPCGLHPLPAESGDLPLFTQVIATSPGFTKICRWK